ncbi:hypothetical protein L3Y34_019418 [Caenorhabditis briggsae]|uniref:Uncharacterized protein n=1 Tax=Caenorhabditis briggsae TaxID=6238 RepID=A0AAE9IW27_CAEBR|nr:hypothetical protein L3Y34_019418 [Caenorhabditis briggsae]
MNTLTILVLLSRTITAACSTFNSEKPLMPENQKSDNQAFLFASIFDDIQGAQNAKKSRSRRLSCGFKLLQKIAGYCGELNSETEVDIASICCRSECSEEFIKRSVCPEML